MSGVLPGWSWPSELAGLLVSLCHGKCLCRGILIDPSSLPALRKKIHEKTTREQKECNFRWEREKRNFGPPSNLRALGLGPYPSAPTSGPYCFRPQPLQTHASDPPSKVWDRRKNWPNAAKQGWPNQVGRGGRAGGRGEGLKGGASQTLQPEEGVTKGGRKPFSPLEAPRPLKSPFEAPPWPVVCVCRVSCVVCRVSCVVCRVLLLLLLCCCVCCCCCCCVCVLLVPTQRRPPSSGPPPPFPDRPRQNFGLSLGVFSWNFGVV